MTSIGKVQAHDTIMRLAETRIDSQVGRGSRIRLHIDAPFLGIEPVSLQGTLLTQNLNLIDELIPTIVSVKILDDFIFSDRA